MTSTTIDQTYDFRSLIAPLAEPGAIDGPLVEAAQRRNVVLDQLFYDIGALGLEECDWLVRERNRKAAILVVWPKGARGPVSIRKYPDHGALSAAPGAPVTRFCVAGVGGSDLGAAALGRNLADHYGEPVGAIVAGYDLADVVGEGLGGWLLLGAVDRWRSLIDDWQRWWLGPTDAAEVPAAETLYRLLTDPDRRIRSLFAHSRGGLVLAEALQRLADTGAAPAREAAKAIDITTVGAVMRLPAGFERAVQFLGTLDWIGQVNSHLDRAYRPVPGAGHHLNSALPLHASVDALLAEAAAAGSVRSRTRKVAA